MPRAAKPPTLLAAVDSTLSTLGTLDAFLAEVTAVRMLAGALDARPGDKDLWREFRLALKALREVVNASGSGEDEGLKTLLARLGDSRMGRPAVRNKADTG